MEDVLQDCAASSLSRAEFCMLPEQEREPSGTQAGDPDNGSEGKATKSRSSRSSRAGLLFPVSRVERQLRSSRFAKRLRAEAPVYLTAVLQCVTEEAVAVAGRIAKDRNQSCISALHLHTALYKSSVLKQLRCRNRPSHHARAGQERQRRALASRKKATKRKQVTKSQKRQHRLRAAPARSRAAAK
ncbi:uncharacterized protein LOC133627132 [Colius striatus]|uniref:uncharacterized protein LOC104556020 n=1 Tax=Colius striatus TaxID=57412 RepID=UPI0005296846|nr:uncharacterized protein LOC104556020 [Colius striatus]XP_061866419.1 uncharacterized protein LOC133627132 [Colius striatus]